MSVMDNIIDAWLCFCFCFFGVGCIMHGLVGVKLMSWVEVELIILCNRTKRQSKYYLHLRDFSLKRGIKGTWYWYFYAFKCVYIHESSYLPIHTYNINWRTPYIVVMCDCICVCLYVLINDAYSDVLLVPFARLMQLTHLLTNLIPPPINL